MVNPFCIDIQYFLFPSQECFLKKQSWRLKFIQAMASCAASRFPNMCTLDGSRFLSESLKGSSFRIQGSVTSTKLHAGGRGSPNRRIGCLCGSFSKTSALCTFAFSLPLVNVQRRGTRHCTGVYAFFPAPGRNSRRSVPGVQSYLCLNGALVKSFGEGVFRNAGESAGSRVEATSANRGFDAESNASNEERMQSGRAATTSGSDSSRERGHEQQLPDPSEAVKPGPSLKGVGQKERVKTTPRKTLLKKRGRDVLKQLIGVQAAWPSAPLLALAREKKESEGKRRSADAPKRKPRAKRTVGLPEGDAEGVRRNENGVKGEGAMLEGGAGQQLGRAGSVESTAGSEAAAAVKIPVMLSVQSQETGTTLRGPRLKAYGDTGAQSREGPEKAGPSLTDEMARKSQKAVPLDAGEPGLEYVEEAPEGTGAAGLNGFAGNVNSDASLERVAGLEGQGAAESVNGFAQDKALRTAVVAQNRVQEQGVGRGVAPSGSRRTEAKNGVSKANGFVREDFLSRLERVQKGLGAKAEVLAREAGVVAAPDRLPATQKGQLSEAGDKVLLSLGALNDPLPPPAEGSRVGRAGNWRSRRALKGVGTRSTAAAAAARAELFGGLEMAGDGTPQEGEDAAGGAVDWGDGPLKRDANTAVAQMVASSKRFQRLRQLARDSKTGGVFPEVAEAPVESGWKPRDENSRNGVGDALGEALGLGRAAVERVVQNGTVPAKGTNEGKVSGEGLPEGLVEKEEELEFEQRGAESVELKDQLAANGQTPQTGAETTGGRMVPEERGRGNASGVEQSGPAALNGAANGAAKEAFGVSEAPTGCADRREAERDALAASTNGHATPGALVAGEKVLRNGALEGPMQSADGRSVSVMEGNGAVKKGSLPVETGAASEGSETVAVVLNGRAAGSTAALNGRASSATNGALFTERVDSGAASRNGALNGVALQSRAESERQAVNSLQSQNGAGGASGPLPKDQTEESVRSPGSDLHGSANGKILVGALNGAALLERGSSVRAEGGQNDGAVSTNGVALKSAPVLVAASGVAEDGTGARARNNLSLPEGVAIAANSRGAENGAGEGLTRETLAAVPTKHLPPPFPIKKRKSAEKMIERSKRPGGPSTGRSDSSSEGSGRRGSAPGGSEDAPVLVTASRKIGEEATEVGSAQPGGNSVPPNQPRNYTLEEDEKLFETLGLRLTGQEMSRIAEWLKSREVPELKLSRPRDRTGRYFLMPVIEAVEKHLREHGRLQSETDIGVIEPATLAETAGGVFTPGATAGPDAGENGDNFFQEMSEELSADVVLQTQELLANQDPAGGPENVRSGTPGAKKAEFLDLFDDSSDSDVESLFQRAGLSTDGRRQRRLESLEKAVIAEYLMGLNKQGADPPRREDWPCAPDGERYSKETLREVWREADEMGGLPAYLKLCRQEEAIERLLVESLSRGQPLKIGEDWREVTAEETRAVDAMHPGERAPALEFMLGLLRGGERLDWKKHRDVWPRKVRTAHLIKARLLLALVKVAQRRGGLEAYLEESRRELAKRLGAYFASPMLLVVFAGVLSVSKKEAGGDSECGLLLRVFFFVRHSMSLCPSLLFFYCLALRLRSLVSCAHKPAL